MTYPPITTVAELEKLEAEGNPDDLLEGYREGREGAPEPGNNRSRLFHHGWRNGACDGGFIKKDAAMAALALDFRRISDEAKAAIEGNNEGSKLLEISKATLERDIDIGKQGFKLFNK